MAFTILITAAELNSHLGDPHWAIVDCRFSLDDTERGLLDYVQFHIPGAVYAHMDHDLSGTKIAGKTGRHPLPEMRHFAETLSSWGIDSEIQVVVYDGSDGSMAARLWWMLYWAGHRQAALLDGGMAAWNRAELPTRPGMEQRPPGRFEARETPGAYVSSEQVLKMAHDPRYRILDARSAPRFLGQVEPIDPVAGHIPGALSSPFELNLTAEGSFLPPAVLRDRFDRLIKSVPVENVICYCGSGVSAAHNLAAIAHAGLGMGRLYAGSWSEWITDPERPVATGSGDRE